ncbi:PREDICTED: uncharacterized protein LOC105448534 [Wasmannia auropunctata]|uniref:uncharacterized protein LOC105448534 n=1 Tax=Wasmannia auropunctata TaxID=64793 RepID=UPI0005EFCFBE|nr:PREDICTED: uncharacterized protein LOC105448534 [Wasmannia auropunctata]
MYGKRRRTSRVSTKRSCTSCKLGSDLISNVTRNIIVNTNIHSKPYMRYSKSVPTIKPDTQDCKNIVYINNDVHENTSDSICSSESSSSSERSISYPVSENENIIDIFETNNWKHDLVAWVVKHQISYTALTSLLQIFKQHPTSSFHVNIEDIHYRNINNDSGNNKDPLLTLSSNLNEKEDSQYSEDLIEIEQVNSGNKDNSNDPLAVPEQNSDNFQCFVTQKLMDLEKKLNQIENNMNTYQKVILQKCSILDSKENKENIYK